MPGAIRRDGTFSPGLSSPVTHQADLDRVERLGGNSQAQENAAESIQLPSVMPT
jgi:hypothetical protein